MEPSIRPDDSRYGENPNRLQRHTQFQVKARWGSLLIVFLYDFLFLSIYSQVILKPDPGNSQDLFIRSLSALGSSNFEPSLLLLF